MVSFRIHLLLLFFLLDFLYFTLKNSGEYFLSFLLMVEWCTTLILVCHIVRTARTTSHQPFPFDFLFLVASFENLVNDWIHQAASQCATSSYFYFFPSCICLAMNSYGFMNFLDIRYHFRTSTLTSVITSLAKLPLHFYCPCNSLFVAFLKEIASQFHPRWSRICNICVADLLIFSCIYSLQHRGLPYSNNY